MLDFPTPRWNATLIWTPPCVAGCAPQVPVPRRWAPEHAVADPLAEGVSHVQCRLRYVLRGGAKHLVLAKDAGVAVQCRRLQ